MRASFRLGLRAQIVLALSLVFALSFWLFAFVTVQLTRRSVELEQSRNVARALAVALDGVSVETSPEAFTRLCEGLDQRFGLRALHLRTADGLLRCGETEPHGDAMQVALESGGELRLWLGPLHGPGTQPLPSLLLFYLALTGLSVLAFSYVALTYLIVRPLERLTFSAQQLAAGGDPVPVREHGAAEVVQLAHTYNRMAVLLRAEQKRLVERLQELERTTAALEHKEQQLIHGEKLASMGRLAAGAAHEIGNPLAAILGLLDLLRDGDLSEAETKEFLDRIHRETERINHIIRDLHDFARRDVQADAGETADLNDVVEDAVSLVRPQKESRAVTIETHVDPSCSVVFGPSQRLLQVLLNLLLNAVDAMHGRGRIVVRVMRALPSDDDAFTLVQVEDDGPGIAEDMLDKLFEPFTTTKPAGQGTGLGLAVTAAIVDGLSGTITAKNKPEGGALFELRLPREKPASPQPAAHDGV